MKDVLDAARARFIATFVTQCDAISTLVDKVAASGRRGPVTTLTSVVHRLNGLAGTIGFPTISARASDLEDLLGDAGRGAFDVRRARGVVDAIRKALDLDLTGPPVRSIPSAGTAAGPPSAIRVLIVDDHGIVRRGLKALLADEFRGAVFGEASNARQAVEQDDRGKRSCTRGAIDLRVDQ